MNKQPSEHNRKQYGTLLFCLVAPYPVGVLTAPASERSWTQLALLVVITCGMLAFANLPGMIERAITHRLVSQPWDLEANAEVLCRRQLQRMEWIRLYPLKRVLLGVTWLCCTVISVMGIVMYDKDAENNILLISLILLTIAACTARKTWRYIITPYHCVPILNKILSKEQIYRLLQGERFELFPFKDETLQKGAPVLVSENWALVDGLLISRKLIHRWDIRRTRANGTKRSQIEVIYLTGEWILTRNIVPYLGGERAVEMMGALRTIAKIHFPRCATKIIAEKYDAILPEIQNPKEKLWYLLTHDVSQIEQAYKAPCTAKSAEPK